MGVGTPNRILKLVESGRLEKMSKKLKKVTTPVRVVETLDYHTADMLTAVSNE